METKEELQQDQYKKMTTEPIGKLVGSLAVPTILSMMVNNFYNMVDTAFVGTLGTSASAAIGVVFGYMAILQAVGFMCGQGSGSIMSRSLGSKDVKKATTYSSTGFFFSFALGIVIGVISFLCLTPLVYLLGSTDTIAVYAKQYISYIIIAAPFMTSSLTMNNLLRYEGKAKLGMVGLLTGAVLNISGDALFIFKFHMGVHGAGLSTCISQVISFGILLSMFLFGKTQTRISIRCVSFHWENLFNIITTGFPSLLRQALNSISTMLLNSHAAVYGDAAVAAMSITSRVIFFVMSMAIGIGQGFQPVSSFNYGAGKKDRVKKAFWFTFFLSEILLVLTVIPVSVYAEPIVRIFRDDPAVTAYAVRALRLQCLAMLLVPISMVTEMGFQSTGQRFYATITSSLRSGILFIPVLLFLANLRGMSGIQEAQPLSNAMTFVVCIFFSRVFLKKLR